MKPKIEFLDSEDVMGLLDSFQRLGSNLREQAIKDLFGVGCYLHAQEDESRRLAGWKACLAALDALELGNSPGVLRKIMDNLSGNEIALLRLFSPHNEISKLLD